MVAGLLWQLSELVVGTLRLAAVFSPASFDLRTTLLALDFGWAGIMGPDTTRHQNSATSEINNAR